MEIGAGITIGGGITLEVPAGGGGGGGGGFTAQASGTLSVGHGTMWGANDYGYAGGFPSFGAWSSDLSLSSFKYATGGGTGFIINSGSGTINGKSYSMSSNVFTYDGTSYTVIAVRVGGSGGTTYTFTQGVSGSWTNYPSTNDEFNLVSYNGQDVLVEFQFIS